MKTFAALLTAVTVAICPGPGRAQENNAAPPARSYGSTPWHLMDAWWDIGTNVPFQRYSIDVTVSDDVPPSVRLYVSPVGLGKLSGTQFYGGIQTMLDGNTKRDPALRTLGPGIIFSMWGERSLDAIRPSDGGFCQSSGHEGDFVSVRRPYAWKKGTYTYSLVSMDREVTDTATNRWVGVFVYSHERDENIFGGALRFKGDDLVLDRRLANFVEIYGREIPLSEIPKVTITFGNLRVNGQPVEHPTATVIYPKNVPDYADVRAENGCLVVKVGEPVANRTARRVPLITKPAGNDKAAGQ